jgi:putative oxidoreductase
MFHKLIHTRDDYLVALLRLALGAVFFAHGAQLVLGWWGGGGFASSMNIFTHGMDIPVALAVLAILSQFLGAIGLVFGFLTRIAALGIAVDMAVATFLVHVPNGFFMNWYGTQKGEGFEFHLLAVAMALTIVARGAGAFSIDRLVDHALTHSAQRPKRDRVPERLGRRDAVLPF